MSIKIFHRLTRIGRTVLNCKLLLRLPTCRQFLLKVVVLYQRSLVFCQGLFVPGEFFRTFVLIFPIFVSAFDPGHGVGQQRNDTLPQYVFIKFGVVVYKQETRKGKQKENKGTTKTIRFHYF